MQKTSTVTVPFMLLGILFNICLVASNLLETKVIQVFGITATAGIGTNLYLAKIAMDIVAKKMPADANGVRIAELDEMTFREKLWDHKPLTDFWRIGGDVACRPILGRRRRFQLRVRNGTAHRHSKPDGFSCRFVPECLRDE